MGRVLVSNLPFVFFGGEGDTPEERPNSLILGGCTKNLLAIPPMENPMSCVDMTTIHW
jgi:hypothetical protein